jgi:hypothetical protein
MLASEIREGQSAFTVHGIFRTGCGGLPSDDGMIRIGVAHDLVGIDAAQVERGHEAILAEDYPHLDLEGDDESEDEDYIEAEHRAYLRVFANWLPCLKFVEGPTGPFRVEELSVDDNSRLIGDVLRTFTSISSGRSDMAGRPPLRIGKHGKITRAQVAKDVWVARCGYRDRDGLTRRLEHMTPDGVAD